MHSFPINTKHIEAFEKRGLDGEVVTRMGVFSCRRAPDGEQDKTPVPDANGDMVAYPFFDEKDNIVNIKYIGRRNKQKLYFQTPGGQKIFYNLQAALDPALQDPDGPGLCIFEGENDTIAGVVAQYPWSIGVPDGGSPTHREDGTPIDMKPDDELDPGDDRKFEFIVNNWKLLEPVRKIILWTDWDAVGQRLRDELSRRLDKVRCFVVHRPSHMQESVVKATVKDKATGGTFEIMRPVKDANEVLEHYGAQAVLDCIASARPMPMMGLYKMSDYEDRNLVTFSTGFRALDPHIKLYDTAFSVCTGLPQSGKSVLWNQIAFNMAELYGWRCAIASFEAPIKPEIQRQLRCFFIKKPRDQWTREDIKHADDFIEEYFSFISRDPLGLEDFRATPEWVCEQIENAVIRDGINMCIADPWNQLDHKRGRGEMRDEYTIDRIKMIKDTGQRVKCAITVIAHPTAEAGRASREGNVLSMYDMADGAAWNNAAEYGMVVHRRSMLKGSTITEPHIRKVKFQQATDCYPGNASIDYIPEEGRFDCELVNAPIDEEIERAAHRR